ncbi:Chromatin structure-remodeling complex subunit SFH1 [Wickerhamiella sorbophila]|uniref:Chromatin structure-remodeling complex subunit SFH1 n=1 Tax=Wickerhamiella sorbophila TaxID=45607 RepID=A0A2T0FHN2_9ASCO|nr:Chromatin structure-remodeling complex subunit SFH1 [Wickerhamiella sorbophila]PRT54467.1 Chromatin structure-remodeling complex subunit SFH1 [Wickerhamiella sorbophila]
MSYVSSSALPQALQTGFASRLRLGQTSLFIHTQPTIRAHKRAAAAVFNYAEIEEDFDDDDDEDPTFGSGPRMERKQEPRRTESKKLAMKTKHPNYSEQQLANLASTEEVLVPLRLSLEYEDYRITDFLMWNINEPSLTPELFATITCNDLELPVGYTANIANSMKSQIAEYTELAQIRLPSDAGIRVVIHLSVNLDKQLYEDKFEWDLDSAVTPEEFARTVVADLAISGEFYPAIAHALHEAILRMKREFIEGHAPVDSDNQAAFNQSAGWRMDQEGLGEDWVPTIEVLTQEEIERREVERERMIRRMKRESARIGTSEFELGGLFGRKRRRRESPAVGSPW